LSIPWDGFMVLKGGSFESCKVVLGTQTRSQNISWSQTCTLFRFNWPHHHFELHADDFWAWAFEVHEEAQRDADFLGINEISSFPKQKCPPTTQVKFYCKIDKFAYNPN
jgi:hypothetical protein